MTTDNNKEIERAAHEIVYLFFDKGARVDAIQYRKVKQALTQAYQAGIDRAVEIIKGKRRKMPTWDFGPYGPPSDFPPVDVMEMEAEISAYNKALDDTIKAIQDNK